MSNTTILKSTQYKITLVQYNRIKIQYNFFMPTISDIMQPKKLCVENFKLC